MRVKNRILILEPYDLDHIIGIYIKKDGIPSEEFKKGLEIETELNGIKKQDYDEIKINLS